MFSIFKQTLPLKLFQGSQSSVSLYKIGQESFFGQIANLLPRRFMGNGLKYEQDDLKVHSFIVCNLFSAGLMSLTGGSQSRQGGIANPVL